MKLRTYILCGILLALNVQAAYSNTSYRFSRHEFAIGSLFMGIGLACKRHPLLAGTLVLLGMANFNNSQPHDNHYVTVGSNFNPVEDLSGSVKNVAHAGWTHGIQLINHGTHMIAKKSEPLTTTQGTEQKENDVAIKIENEDTKKPSNSISG